MQACGCLPGYGKDDCSEIQHCPGNDDDESPCGHGECAYGNATATGLDRG